MKDAVKRYLSSHTEPAVSACLPRVLSLQCRMKDDIKSYLSSVGVDWEEVNDLAMVRRQGGGESGRRGTCSGDVSVEWLACMTARGRRAGCAAWQETEGSECAHELPALMASPNWCTPPPSWHPYPTPTALLLASAAPNPTPQVAADVDVLYQTRIQKERFQDRPEDYEKAKGALLLAAGPTGVLELWAAA